MSEDVFFSSDSVRSAAPLRYAQKEEFTGPVRLELGGELAKVEVVYETYGKLNAERSNAVLICHALSGDSHVARHNEADDPGWWDIVVGPGKTIDTEKYFVICPNILGGCRGTTGPNSINPATGRPYGADFPVITVGDMVDVQRMLLDRLGIQQLLAVVGGSLGGHQALMWAIRYPERVRGCVAIATSPRLTSQALAFDVVGRNAIRRDPHFHKGQYYDRPTKPTVGLALARMLGHITYLSREAMMEKFDPTRYQPRDIPTEFEKMFSVGSYLAYQGHKFVERFDANSYITLSLAMDLFDLAPAADPQGQARRLREALGKSMCRWLVISFSSDWLFPPFQSRQIVDALIAEGKSVSYCNVQSTCGHDAFLLEDDLGVYGRLMAAFLENLAEPEKVWREMGTEWAKNGRSSEDPTSIFYHGNRLDYQRILDLVPTGASVLDVGCGDGELLCLLRRRGHRRLMGVELDQEAVLRCVERGLDVVQMDLNEGLGAFPDGSFDVVVLSQTLQSIPDTKRVVEEILRVGRMSIVSFPNFAFRPMREMLFYQGRSPKARGLYSYEWYESPNRRYPSILDFQEFCQAQGIRIHREVYLDSQAGKEVREDPNLNADIAIFVLSR